MSITYSVIAVVLQGIQVLKKLRTHGKWQLEEAFLLQSRIAAAVRTLRLILPDRTDSDVRRAHDEKNIPGCIIVAVGVFKRMR